MAKQNLLVIAMILLIACGTSSDSTTPLALTDSQFQSDDVSYEAWLVLLSYLDSLGEDDYAPLVKDLPQHWRAVYTTFWLECEVDNGGHHQFFWNSDGALNSGTLEDLKYIGPDDYAAVFAAALETYGQHDYEQEKRASGNSWEGFTAAYREKRLEDCDSRFYKLTGLGGYGPLGRARHLHPPLRHTTPRNRNVYDRILGEPTLRP